MNKVMLIGNVGKEPEMTYLPSGSPVTKFSLAVNRRWNDKSSGEQKEETIWFSIVAWDRLAESCVQLVHKGTKLFVEGRLSLPRAYMDKNNQPQAAVDVIITNMELLTPKGGEAGAMASGVAPSSKEDDPGVIGGTDFPF